RTPSDCCARVAAGHITALPSRVINARRLIAGPEAQTRHHTAQTALLKETTTRSLFPLWVRSGRDALKFRCPLCPRKRTRPKLRARVRRYAASGRAAARAP